MSHDFTNYPLPPEWEQKYDWESKRFFYVDHVNKKTTWIDPRITLHKKDHQEMESTNENSAHNDPLGVLRIPSSNKSISSVTNNRQKKASEIQQKYTEFALDKIIDLLEKNYDNISSVESILQREQQVKIQLDLAAKNAEKEEMERRIKEETEKLIKEETEKRIKAENEKRLKEEAEKRNNAEVNKRIKDDLMKQKIILDAKIKSEENKGQKSKDSFNKNGQVIKPKLEEKIKDVDDQNIPTSDQNENKSDETRNSNSTESVKTKLNKGPNKIIYNGPNRLNQIGPNRNLVNEKREKLAKGPNSANYCGPQVNLNVRVSN